MPEQMEQPAPAPQAQQPGLSENAVCGLAYLTIIPAIVFLATPPYNQTPKVRFHAWQSIALAIAWVVVWVALTVVGFMPVIRWINIVIVPLVWLGFVVTWLIVMINAFSGKTIRLPIIAPFAAKQAGM